MEKPEDSGKRHEAYLRKKASGKEDADWLDRLAMAFSHKIDIVRWERGYIKRIEREGNLDWYDI